MRRQSSSSSAVRLLEQIGWHTRLSDVVHKGGDAELVQLKLGHSDSLSERDCEDAHVHRVRVRVLIVLAQRGESDQRRFFGQHLVDYGLHRALDLPRARARVPFSRN